MTARNNVVRTLIMVKKNFSKLWNYKFSYEKKSARFIEIYVLFI